MSCSSKLDIVITGWGRSGTHSMQNLLSSAGIPCTHERVFHSRKINKWRKNGYLTNERLSARVQEGAESSWYALPFLGFPLCDSATIVHVFRDPLRVLSSYMANRVLTQRDTVSFLYWALAGMSQEFPFDDLVDSIGQGNCPGGEELLLEATSYFMLRWAAMLLEAEESSRYLRYRVDRDDPAWLVSMLGGNVADLYYNSNDHHYVDVRQLGILDVPSQYRDQFKGLVDLWIA